jgi:hypothetical protein
MDMSEQDQQNTEPSEEKSELPQEQQNRIDILRKIEKGELNVDDAIEQLQGEEKARGRAETLDLLEAGEIDVQEALKILEERSEEGTSQTVMESASEPEATAPARQVNSFWLVLLACGLGITALGGWLGTISGWWWLCAAPSLIMGIAVLALALATIQAPWLHLNVDTGEKSWPQHIRLNLPVPIQLTSWALKKWGTRSDRLDQTAVDELITILEGDLSSETPIYIEVNAPKGKGERK